MKKLSILTLSFSLVFCAFLISCSLKSDMSVFKENKAEMESIVQKILDGEIKVDDDGMFKLTEESASLSDTGEGCIVEYGFEDYRVYFFTFRGTLGSSKGFLYKLSSEEYSVLNKSSNRFNFVKVETIDDRWCKVSTDD